MRSFSGKVQRTSKTIILQTQKLCSIWNGLSNHLLPESNHCRLEHGLRYVFSKLQLEEFVFQPHQLQKGVFYFVEVQLWCQMAIICRFVASRNQEDSSIEKLNKLWKLPKEDIFENNPSFFKYIFFSTYLKTIKWHKVQSLFLLKLFHV